MNTNSPLHHRRSIRLRDYDYSQSGGYFITVVTNLRERLFEDIVNGEMRLNEFGGIVKNEWFKTRELRPNVELFEEEFVVMPNHVHGIIWLIDDCRGTARRAPTVEQFGVPVPGSIPTIIRSFKSAVTKQINMLRQTAGTPVWQRNYYEHIINSDRDYDQIAEYIYTNPQNWKKDGEFI